MLNVVPAFNVYSSLKKVAVFQEELCFNGSSNYHKGCLHGMMEFSQGRYPQEKNSCFQSILSYPAIIFSGKLFNNHSPVYFTVEVLRFFLAKYVPTLWCKLVTCIWCSPLKLFLNNGWSSYRSGLLYYQKWLRLPIKRYNLERSVTFFRSCALPGKQAMPDKGWRGSLSSKRELRRKEDWETRADDAAGVSTWILLFTLDWNKFYVQGFGTKNFPPVRISN